MSVVVPVTLTDQEAEDLRTFATLTHTQNLDGEQRFEWMVLQEVLPGRLLTAAACAMRRLETQEAHP